MAKKDKDLDTARDVTILEDLTANLKAQRDLSGKIREAKQKRGAVEHELNTMRSRTKAFVASIRLEDGRPEYGSDPKIADKTEEILNDETTKLGNDYAVLSDVARKCDEDVNTNKLDLVYTEGEWKVLVIEANLLAAKMMSGSGCVNPQHRFNITTQKHEP